MAERWGLLVRQGSQALLGGRFRECERLAGEAAHLAPTEPEPGLLAVAACREQGRAAEAEILLRDLLARHPAIAEGQALLSAVLADLGRDAEARRQLDRLPKWTGSLASGALGAEAAAALGSYAHAAALLGPLRGHADTFVDCYGSVSRHLGLLSHVLGRWDEAEAHFRVALEANAVAGAPVLVAHTRRQYSALLRARGDEGDWERAIDLLAEAAAIYRRLEIERLAEEAEGVLRRSQDLPPPGQAGAGENVFRRTAAGWDVAYRGQRAVVADASGMAHVATLLAAGGRPVHAVELVESPLGPGLGEEVVAEYRSRLAEVEAELDAADPVIAALARAERDALQVELAAGVPRPRDVGDSARRLVALRIRTSLDRLDESQPALARHLRRSIRTGTFCLYDAEPPERWEIGR